MNKRPTLLLILIFSFFTGICQKVKIKDLDVKAKYFLFPSIGLPKNITTYHVKLIAKEDALSQLGYTGLEIKNSMLIPNYKKSEENVGAEVLLTLDGPVGSTLKLLTDNKKDKSGKAWNEYSYQVIFSGSMNVKIFDASGALLDEFLETYSETKKSPTYNSTAQLRKSFDSMKFYLRGRKSALKDILEETRKSLAYKYGYRPKEEKVEFKRLDSDKHPDYNEFLKIETIVRSAFDNMSHADNQNFLADIQPAIDFWTSIEPAYSGSDKQQKKLKYACQYNSALAYYYAEDLDQSAAFATMVKNGDYDEKDGRKLLEKIEKLKELFAESGRTSRHITIKMSQEALALQEEKREERKKAIESGDIRMFPSFDAKMKVGSRSSINKITVYSSNGDVDEGYLVYEKKLNGKPDFRLPRQLRFGYDSGGEIKLATLIYGKIDSFNIEGISYFVSDVILGAGSSKLSLENAIVQMVKEYDRSNLGIVYPPAKKGKSFFGTSNDNLQPELVVFDKEAELIHATSGLMGANRPLKKMVAACEPSATYLNLDNRQRNKPSDLPIIEGFAQAQMIDVVLSLYDDCKE